MKYWSFKSFVTDSGRNVFQLWMDSQTISVRATIHETLDQIEILPKLGPPFTKKLVGYDAIWELRAKADNTQWRPLFCLGLNGEIIFLVGATKTGDKKKTKWDPINALETAEKRHKLISGDRRYISEYKRASG